MWWIDPGPQEDAKPTGTRAFLDSGGRSNLARDITQWPFWSCQDGGEFVGIKELG
jgi:hypothetical protein